MPVGPGEKRLELRGEIAGGDPKERVLHDRVGVAALAKLAAKLGDLARRSVRRSP